MATPSTINTWLNDLALSIIHDRPHRQPDSNRLQETFRKRVKRHNYARTNPFAVTEHLNGLEEKFQVLTLDGLSDALHQRRQELREYQQHWLPDVLDLLLNLTGDPVHNDGLLELYRIPPRLDTPLALRWRDVLKDDPLDEDEYLWKVPDFRSGLSVYDDDGDDTWNLEDEGSSPTRRSSSMSTIPDESALFLKHAKQDDMEAITQPYLRLDAMGLHEYYVAREILLFCRGYDSTLLSRDRGRYHFSTDLRLSGASPSVTKELLRRIVIVREHLDVVHSWKARQHQEDYLQALEQAVEQKLVEFESSLDQRQQMMLAPTGEIAISVLQTVTEIESNAQELISISDFLRQSSGTSATGLLDKLCERLDLAQLCNDEVAVGVFHSLLGPVLRLYLAPLLSWIWGSTSETPSVLVSVEADAAHVTQQSVYQLTGDGSRQLASFLHPHLCNLLACGRAVTILRTASPDFKSQITVQDFELRVQGFLDDCLQFRNIPFSTLLESRLGELVSSILGTRTREVKRTLINAGFDKTLDAIGSLYLSQDRTLVDSIELKMFEQIDKCANNWSDRFLLADMLEAVYTQYGMFDVLGNVRVAAKFTSARNMVSRRRSVRILAAVTFQYALPWLSANIIPDSAMRVYRRVHLMLMQIRRTKYCLERRGFWQVISQPISQASHRDQLFAQCLAYNLVGLVNSLYDHFTTSVVTPMTKHMRAIIYQAQTIDGMIETHATYLARLESACLVSSKLKVIRDATIKLLDLCIRFSDLVSTSTTTGDTESDAETNSFISAEARHARQNDDVASDSGEDEDNPGEGYSSFIVLEDDTNVMKELHKLKSTIKRQLDFLVAGLRGVSHTGVAAVEMEILADRLEQFLKDFR